MKYILPLLLLPSFAFAWTAPKLTSACSVFTIELVPEANQVIEFSTDNFETILQTKDFGGAGTYNFTLPVTGVLHARYKSDKKVHVATTQTESCAKPVEKTVEKKRRKSHGFKRKLIVIPPVTMTVFDLPLFDYPESPLNLKD